MKALPHIQPRVTEQEYLALEERSVDKHEYLDGEVYALAGASKRHNVIFSNILGALWSKARGTDCFVLGSDQRLRIQNADEVYFYYPDIQLVCDPEDNNPNYVTRPCLIVEIESPSTASIDHREKLLAYRTIESLQAYLIVAQDRRHVVRHFRDDNGAWWRDEAVGSGSLPVPCTGGTLDLETIYERAFDVL
jgi:Uma2 family endonuclease